ncbi:DUF3108 domain-containing protein [Nitratifractor sp.]|uniref:DUF3108 domain-containing protein n=1 Tax=Nitratifractor sp. TaxID=2268144 RepID=UPI0025D8720D|nr:DUF3108 domain-containing protein [Nitratifractor sp.]
MKRLMCVWLITVVASRVLAAEVWEYRVSSALFGTLGKVTMREERTGKQYHITAVAETRGIAATLTRHRKYRAESRGIVGTQRRHSRYYLYEVVDHKKHKRDEYRIDPKAKKVIKTSQRWKKGKPEKKEQHRLDYYTDRDLASLFYDLVTAPTAIRSGEYPAVGAEKSHGRVRIELPDARSAQKERERLQASPQSRILYILIDQKGGKQRKIIAAVTPQGRLESAYTVAVPVVGVLYMKPR